MTELESFIETGLWSTIDYDSVDSHLDSKYSIDDVSDEFKLAASKFINQFMEGATGLFTDSELESAPIGHDLWLTVEGHGAGFWDGDYKNGDALTDLVKSIQSYDSFWSDLLNESINRNAAD